MFEDEFDPESVDAIYTLDVEDEKAYDKENVSPVPPPSPEMILSDDDEMMVDARGAAPDVNWLVFQGKTISQLVEQVPSLSELAKYQMEQPLLEPIHLTGITDNEEYSKLKKSAKKAMARLSKGRAHKTLFNEAKPEGVIEDKAQRKLSFVVIPAPSDKGWDDYLDDAAMKKTQSMKNMGRRSGPPPMNPINPIPIVPIIEVDSDVEEIPPPVATKVKKSPVKIKAPARKKVKFDIDEVVAFLPSPAPFVPPPPTAAEKVRYAQQRWESNPMDIRNSEMVSHTDPLRTYYSHPTLRRIFSSSAFNPKRDQFVGELEETTPSNIVDCVHALFTAPKKKALAAILAYLYTSVTRAVLRDCTVRSTLASYSGKSWNRAHNFIVPSDECRLIITELGDPLMITAESIEELIEEPHFDEKKGLIGGFASAWKNMMCCLVAENAKPRGKDSILRAVNPDASRINITDSPYVGGSTYRINHVPPEYPLSFENVLLNDVDQFIRPDEVKYFSKTQQEIKHIRNYVPRGKRAYDGEEYVNPLPSGHLQQEAYRDEMWASELNLTPQQRAYYEEMWDHRDNAKREDESKGCYESRKRRVMLNRHSTVTDLKLSAIQVWEQGCFQIRKTTYIFEVSGSLTYSIEGRQFGDSRKQFFRRYPLGNRDSDNEQVWIYIQVGMVDDFAKENRRIPNIMKDLVNKPNGPAIRYHGRPFKGLLDAPVRPAHDPEPLVIHLHQMQRQYGLDFCPDL